MGFKSSATTSNPMSTLERLSKPTKDPETLPCTPTDQSITPRHISVAFESSIVTTPTSSYQDSQPSPVPKPGLDIIESSTVPTPESVLSTISSDAPQEVTSDQGSQSSTHVAYSTTNSSLPSIRAVELDSTPTCKEEIADANSSRIHEPSLGPAIDKSKMSVTSSLWRLGPTWATLPCTSIISYTTNAAHASTYTPTLPATVTVVSVPQSSSTLLSSIGSILDSAMSTYRPVVSNMLGHPTILPIATTQSPTKESPFIDVWITTTVTYVVFVSTSTERMPLEPITLSSTIADARPTHGECSLIVTPSIEGKTKTVVSPAPYASISTGVPFDHRSTTSSTLILSESPTSAPSHIPNPSHTTSRTFFASDFDTVSLSRVSSSLLSTFTMVVPTDISVILSYSESTVSTSSSLYTPSVPSDVVDINTVLFTMFGSIAVIASQTVLDTPSVGNPIGGPPSPPPPPPPPKVITSTRFVTYTVEPSGPGLSINPTATQSLPVVPTDRAGWDGSSAIVTALPITSLPGPVSPTEVRPVPISTPVGNGQSSSTPRSSNLFPTATVTTKTLGSTSPTESGAATSTEASNFDTTPELDNGSSTYISSPSPARETETASGSPALSTTQTAGVAVGGTIIILFAAVALIFVVRRYLAKRADKDVLPKETYLYDRKTGRDSKGSRDYDSEALIYGMPRRSLTGRRSSRFSSVHGQRYGTGSITLERLRNLENPFNDPDYPYQDNPRPTTATTVQRSNNAAAALSAAIAGYAVTSQGSPPMSRYSSQQPHPLRPTPTFSPTFSPRHSYGTSAGRSSIQSYNAKLINTPYSVASPVASEYPTLSPYGPSGLRTVQESRYSDNDPFDDLFEHDLLMHVDGRSEYSNFVAVIASPTAARTPTPRTPVGPKLPIRTSARSSLLSPMSSRHTPRLHSRISSDQSAVSNESMSTTSRFSLAYDNNTSATYLAPSNKKEKASPVVTAPSVRAHNGSEDIKRFSLAYDTSTSTTYLAPTKNIRADISGPKFSTPRLSPPPMRRNSLLQMQQQEPVISYAGQTLRSPHYEEHNTLAIPGASGMRRDGSDSPTLTESVYSINPSAHSKRTAEIEFADPKLIGRSF